MTTGDKDAHGQEAERRIRRTGLRLAAPGLAWLGILIIDGTRGGGYWLSLFLAVPILAVACFLTLRPASFVVARSAKPIGKSSTVAAGALGVVVAVIGLGGVVLGVDTVSSGQPVAGVLMTLGASVFVALGTFGAVSVMAASHRDRGRERSLDRWILRIWARLIVKQTGGR